MMMEQRELIHTTEQIELFMPTVTEGAEATPPVPPPVRGRGLAGLMIGVAIFAMGFLLCDGAYALRGAMGEGLSEGDLPPLLTESMTQTAVSTTDMINESMPPQEQAPREESVTETSQTVEKVPAETLSAEMLYTYDEGLVPNGMIPIVPMDLSLSSYGESFLYNDTSYDLSRANASGDGAIPASAKAGAVSVLILHTHATEGYSPEGALWYDPSTTLARADDPSEGVIAVGAKIAEILNARGIITVHSTVLHDAESYKDSYSRAAETVKSYLEKYPSIRLVIDVHRDSILTSKDQLVRPVTPIGGEAVAQVMCVVGSDAAGGTHGIWRDNLSLALTVRRELNARYANLCRPVYVKKSTYNQQYAPSSLLLEIGSSGNTLEEALRAATLVAEQLAQMLE
jgi:stage II sporulation protein P